MIKLRNNTATRKDKTIICPTCDGVGNISVPVMSEEEHASEKITVCPDCNGVGRVEVTQ